MILVKYLKDDAPRALRLMLRAADPAASQAAPLAALLAAYAEALRDGWYVDAAEVAGHDLECAFKALQNGGASESWTLAPPPGVTPLLPPITHQGRQYGNRSVMMGDLFAIDGQWFVCAAFGFQPLPDPLSDPSAVAPVLDDASSTKAAGA
jgi:hypothetical protein